MRTLAIVQARMGSKRLPGKVLMQISGKPALWHVVNRLGQAKTLKGAVVVTSIKETDDPIARFCREHSIPCFRGSEEDVLERYFRAAQVFDADPVVRITADCPAIDPAIVDEVVSGYAKGGYDVFGLSGEFPDGLDCTVFSFKALKKAHESAKLRSEREHVVPYMEKEGSGLAVGRLERFKGLGHHRWTLDEERDLIFLREVFGRLYVPGKVFHAADVLALLEREPELLKINGGIQRNEGYVRSLLEERKASGD